MNSKMIGSFICERRRTLGMTQQQLADALDVTNKAVSKWETGEGYPDITILPGLAKALHVTADELLAGEPSRSNNGMPVYEAEQEKPKRGKKFSGSVLSIVGVLLAIGVFMMDIEDSSLSASYSTFIPMYAVSLVLITFGFVSNIVSNNSVRQRD